MALRLTQADWDHLLDGESRIIDLDVLGFDGGLSGFRALVYYQVDKRRGRVKTKKLDSSSMIIQAFGCRPLRDVLVTLPPLYSPASAPQEPQPTPEARPHSRLDDPNVDADDLTEAERTELLGPCTCGQSPICLSTCARAS